MERQQPQRRHHAVVRFGLAMPARVWYNAKIDVWASMLFSLFNVVLNQFFMPFAIREGASNLQVGLLSAAPAIGLIFSPLWASIIERTGKYRLFYILPNAIGRVLLVFPALFPHPTVYVATAVSFQLLMGIQAPAYASLIPKMYPWEVRGRIMGYVRVAMGALMIPLAYIVGSWSDHAGPSGPLYAAALFGILSTGLFNTIRLPKTPAVQADSKKKQKRSAKETLKEQWSLVKGNRMLAVFLLATTFAGFGNMLANPLYQIIQVDELDLTNVQIGVARIAYYSGLLLTYLAAGWMIDRYDIRYTLMVGIGAYAVVPMLYGIWGTYSAVILGNGIQGMGEAIWDIGILSFIFRLVPGREGVIFGVHLMLFGFRGTLGPLLSASLSESVALSSLLIIASICGWIGTSLFILGSRGRVKDDHPLEDSST
ncbi:MFS transporter [Paenibacillus cellulosilyticus]|uniref:MFS transporter n=1 Tax=Paenibacillus cellulosilyticus TaxID=375489 RepID=A0A2V2YAE6_9BACL|nr:MFS transporter [Paenibacillus cellulosilyticus]PWV88451.1 MFS transporter [Paenibacillus cellulosilyticus]QKS44283.1 MFS transporter [Paenibacillus cellulosilyticus]